MSGLASLRKVVLFGLLGAAGCLAGWFIGELFLWIALPASKEAGGSLASKPVLPPLANQTATPAPPSPAALPDAVALNRAFAPTAAPPPTLAVGASKTSAPPAAAPPALPAGAAQAPTPPPPEFAQRLQQAGAKSGNVQITLIWFNVNDLDLHCIEPSGNEIFYGNRRCMALKFWENDGQVYCLDVLSEKTYPVSPGYRHPLKKAEVVVCSNDKGAKTRSMPPPRKRAAAPPVAVPHMARAVAPTASPKQAAHPPKAEAVPTVSGAHAAASPKSSQPPMARVSQPNASPPANQEPAVPIKGTCPVCGDTSTGVPGQRRCKQCFTMF